MDITVASSELRHARSNNAKLARTGRLTSNVRPVALRSPCRVLAARRGGPLELGCRRRRRWRAPCRGPLRASAV